MAVRCLKCSESINLRKQRVGSLVLCAHCGAVLRARVEVPSDDGLSWNEEDETQTKVKHRAAKRAESIEYIELIDESADDRRGEDLFSELAQLKARARWRRGVWIVHRNAVERDARLQAALISAIVALILIAIGYTLTMYGGVMRAGIPTSAASTHNVSATQPSHGP